MGFPSHLAMNSRMAARAGELRSSPNLRTMISTAARLLALVPGDFSSNLLEGLEHGHAAGDFLQDGCNTSGFLIARQRADSRAELFRVDSELGQGGDAEQAGVVSAQKRPRPGRRTDRGPAACPSHPCSRWRRGCPARPVRSPARHDEGAGGKEPRDPSSRSGIRGRRWRSKVATSEHSKSRSLGPRITASTGRLGKALPARAASSSRAEVSGARWKRAPPGLLDEKVGVFGDERVRRLSRWAWWSGDSSPERRPWLRGSCAERARSAALEAPRKR